MSTSKQETPLVFACPECKRSCRLSIKQRALQHEIPSCKTYLVHRTNPQEFLRLALIAADKPNFALRPEADPAQQKQAKADLIEQLVEGLKKL